MMALQEMAVLNGFNVIYGFVKFFIFTQLPNSELCGTQIFLKKNILVLRLLLFKA